MYPTKYTKGNKKYGRSLGSAALSIMLIAGILAGLLAGEGDYDHTEVEPLRVMYLLNQAQHNMRRTEVLQC